MRFSRKQTWFYIALAAAMVLKFFPQGFVYFLYMDDYNAYGAWYQTWRQGGGLLAIYGAYGLYTARPLAGLVDLLLVTPLWNHLWIIVVLMAGLHTVSLILMSDVFKKCGLPWGNAASLLFGLYPLLAGSTYWISASVRIVPGFFFFWISAYFLVRQITKGRGWPGAVGFGLVSLGFYEQTVTFGVAVYALILWSHRKHLAGKRRGWFFWPVGYAGVIAAYYALFIGSGINAERAALTHAGLLTQVTDTFAAIGRLFFNEQLYNLSALGVWELGRLWRQPFTYGGALLLGAVLSAGLAWGLYHTPPDVSPSDAPLPDKPLPDAPSPEASPPDVSPLDTSPGSFPCRMLYYAVSIGLLFVAAFGPFFLLHTQYLYLRNLFFCIPALGLLCQAVWDGLNRRLRKEGAVCRLREKEPPHPLHEDKQARQYHRHHRYGRTCRIVRIGLSVMAGVVIYFCLLLNFGAINAYKINSEADRAIADHIVQVLQSPGPTGAPLATGYEKVWLLGTRYQYIPHGGVGLESSTLSDWALTGLVNVRVRALSQQPYTAREGLFINPVMRGTPFSLEGKERDLILAVNDDLSVRVLTISAEGLYDAVSGEMYETP